MKGYFILLLWFNRYIWYWHLQFLINVIIFKTNLLGTGDHMTIFLPKMINLQYKFPIFWL
jgi:hypothetical protein